MKNIEWWCQTGVVFRVMSDEWQKLSDGNWVMKQNKKKIEQPRRKEKKKKGQKWSKVAVGTVCGSPFVCLITILSLSYELRKLKTAKMCFQLP